MADPASATSGARPPSGSSAGVARRGSRAFGLARALTAALVCLFATSQAHGQAIEVVPFAGASFGGSVRDTAFDESRSLAAAPVYGGLVSFDLDEDWRWGLIYSRQKSALEGRSSPSFDLTVERYLVGVEHGGGEGRAQWFGSTWAGATRFAPGLEGFGPEFKVTTAIGLGAKLSLAKHLGLRVEARGYLTLVTGEGGILCNSGRCLMEFAGDRLWQADISGGLVLAF